MGFVEPVTLSYNGVLLVPLGYEHVAGLEAAAADGQLWLDRLTSVPEPGLTRGYVTEALRGREAGDRFAFAVIAESTGEVLGTTSFHGIDPAVRRVQIGYTWYAASAQRTHVNTTGKLLLMEHGFDELGCNVIGWQTDIFNHASQRAIERLGAKRDGVVRGHALRRDGTIRDTVMYSVTQGEWPEIRAHLEYLLASHGSAATVLEPRHERPLEPPRRGAVTSPRVESAEAADGAVCSTDEGPLSLVRLAP